MNGKIAKNVYLLGSANNNVMALINAFKRLAHVQVVGTTDGPNVELEVGRKEYLIKIRNSPPYKESCVIEHNSVLTDARKISAFFICCDLGDPDSIQSLYKNFIESGIVRRQVVSTSCVIVLLNITSPETAKVNASTQLTEEIKRYFENNHYTFLSYDIDTITPTTAGAILADVIPKLMPLKLKSLLPAYNEPLEEVLVCEKITKILTEDGRIAFKDLRPHKSLDKRQRQYETIYILERSIAKKIDDDILQKLNESKAFRQMELEIKLHHSSGLINKAHHYILAPRRSNQNQNNNNNDFVRAEQRTTASLAAITIQNRTYEVVTTTTIGELKNKVYEDDPHAEQYLWYSDSVPLSNETLINTLFEGWSANLSVIHPYPQKAAKTVTPALHDISIQYPSIASGIESARQKQKKPQNTSNSRKGNISVREKRSFLNSNHLNKNPLRSQIETFHKLGLKDKNELTRAISEIVKSINKEKYSVEAKNAYLIGAIFYILDLNNGFLFENYIPLIKQLTEKLDSDYLHYLHPSDQSYPDPYSSIIQLAVKKSFPAEIVEVLIEKGANMTEPCSKNGGLSTPLYILLTLLPQEYTDYKLSDYVMENSMKILTYLLENDKVDWSKPLFPEDPELTETFEERLEKKYEFIVTSSLDQVVKTNFLNAAENAAEKAKMKRIRQLNVIQGEVPYSPTTNPGDGRGNSSSAVNTKNRDTGENTFLLFSTPNNNNNHNISPESSIEKPESLILPGSRNSSG